MVAQTIPRLEIIHRNAWVPDELAARIRGWNPKTELGKTIYTALRYLPAELAGELLEQTLRVAILTSSLAVKVFRTSDSPYRCTPLQLIGGRLLAVEDYGITSRKKVTTQGVTALCVAWGSAAFNMIYMSMGTAATAEANTDTVASFVEITPASHYTSSVRPTCTHIESTNTVPLVATHTQATAGDTIEEHGINDSATQEAGNLWDRSLTGTVVLAVADSLQGTQTLTVSAEA